MRIFLKAAVPGLLVTAMAAALAAPATQASKRTSDLIIRGGTIYDGASVKSLVGDVAISGDRIVYVGPSARNPYRGKRLIDANGMISRLASSIPIRMPTILQRERGRPGSTFPG